jgi:ABC-type glycerol-3-phosphate transport system permease component
MTHSNPKRGHKSRGQITLSASRDIPFDKLVLTESAFTVPIMLTGVVSGDFGSVDWGALQASVVVSMLPCLLVYLALQKYYVSGLLAGAVK